MRQRRERRKEGKKKEGRKEEGRKESQFWGPLIVYIIQMNYLTDKLYSSKNMK